MPVIRGTHHVGISVDDMDRALAFWRDWLELEPTSRRTIEAAFLGELVGYPGVVLEIAWLELPGGLLVELVRHADRPEAPQARGTAHPGTVHLCFDVADLDDVLGCALAAGGELASTAPVEIPSGPNAGFRHVYLRTPDGVSVELRQPPA